PLLNWSFAVVLLTGVWLFLRDPIGLGLHTMFLPKLVLVLAGALYVRAIRLPAGVRLQRFAPRGMACVAVGLRVAASSPSAPDRRRGTERRVGR
ncbi:MAG TPA: hypothetical protein VE690_21520, partial [Rhodopila sp.]|nr:hypothetical protein [Rhodopila sp.]